MKQLALIACVFFVLGFTDAVQAKQVLFVVDASGSMQKQMPSGKTKWQEAVLAFQKSFKDLPKGTKGGLRVFGHRENQIDKDKSCLDSELVHSLAQINASTKNPAEYLNSLSPKGYTPLSFSLEKAKEDFDLSIEEPKAIIVLSDGEETCGGDPAAVAKKLHEAGIQLKIFTIGFDVDERTKAQLQAIAQNGGGKYFDAANQEALYQALTKAQKQAQLVEKAEQKIYGEKIRGGDSYETAIALPLNKEMRLDHHQKADQYDYFYLDVEKGQEFTVTLKTLTKGVRIKDGKVVKETNYPYAGAQIHDSNRTRIKRLTITGSQNFTKQAVVSAKQKGRFYLLIGYQGQPLNAEHVTFEVNLKLYDDLGSGKDAPDHHDGAIPMASGLIHLGQFDKIDAFVVQAKAGQKPLLTIRPKANYLGKVEVKITDDLNAEIYWKGSAENAGLRMNDFTFENAGTYFLYIKQHRHQSIRATTPFEITWQENAE